MYRLGMMGRTGWRQSSANAPVMTSAGGALLPEAWFESTSRDFVCEAREAA